MKTGILFIDLASDLVDYLLAAYSNAGRKSEDGNSIHRSRKRPFDYLLAAYSKASMNSEDRNSIYRSHKRPVLVSFLAAYNNAGINTTVKTVLLFIDLASDLPLKNSSEGDAFFAEGKETL